MNGDLKDNFQPDREFRQFEAMQQEAKSRLTPARILTAFDEIRATNAPPLPGDELPVLP